MSTENNVQRLHWLDAVRGVALSVTMFLHLMRWFLASFQGWQFTDPSFINWEVGFIRFIEGYLRMSWLSPFAFAFIITLGFHNYTLKWISKRFALLVLLPSLIYGLLAFNNNFESRWEVIQSLFFYNLVGLFIVDLKFRTRLMFYVALLGACIYMHYNYQELLSSGSFFWKLMVGGIKENNFFSIISGFPCFFVFFEEALWFYKKDKDDLNTRPLWMILWGSLAVLLVLWATGFNKIEPQHYPSQFGEYLGSIIISNLTIILCYNNRLTLHARSFLSILGRYCWVHFIGHLAVGTLVFEYLHLGNNQMSFPVGFALSILVLLGLWKSNVWFLNYREKRGYDVNAP